MCQFFSFFGIFGVETLLVGYDPLLGEEVIRDSIIFQRSYSGIFWIKEGGISLQGFLIDVEGKSLIAGSLLDDNIIITRLSRGGETLFHLIKERDLYVGKYSGEKNGFTKLSLNRLDGSLFRLSTEQEKLLKKP